MPKEDAQGLVSIKVEEGKVFSHIVCKSTCDNEVRLCMLRLCMLQVRADQNKQQFLLADASLPVCLLVQH